TFLASMRLTSSLAFRRRCAVPTDTPALLEERHDTGTDGFASTDATYRHRMGVAPDKPCGNRRDHSHRSANMPSEQSLPITVEGNHMPKLSRRISSIIPEGGKDGWELHFHALQRLNAGEDILMMSVGDHEFATPRET